VRQSFAVPMSTASIWYYRCNLWCAQICGKPSVAAFAMNDAPISAEVPACKGGVVVILRTPSLTQI
jgi:hypothetical protein